MADDPTPLVVRVVADVPAIAKEFDYLVPPRWRDQVRVGTMVRVDLHGRRVGAWVVAVGITASTSLDKLKPIAKITGWGPSAEMIELARWAAWRWAGRLVPLLVSASPPGAVVALPPPSGEHSSDLSARLAAGGDAVRAESVRVVAASALAAGEAVVRLPPTVDPMGVLVAALERGRTLVICPSVSMARLLATRLHRAGAAVALVPRDWAKAAAGVDVVVGARAAAWAPCPDLAAVVVLDEHDEVLAEERAPTWNARDVAVARARVAGAACVLVSPCPSLDALVGRRLFTLSRTEERAAWPIIDIVDRSRETGPAAAGTISERLARALHGDGRAVCVLNRPGKARLLACTSCGNLARCEACGSLVVEDDPGVLRCLTCGVTRPVVCLVCSSTRLVNRRPGVARIATDLAKMLGEPVDVLTGDTADTPLSSARVLVGTEAALHQVPDARLVAFLDLDAELLAPRFRAGEQALGLLARAARLVGPRAGGGRVVVQTRLGRHEVLDAVVQADPGRFSTAELARRRELSLPPASAMAALSGAAAEAFAAELRGAGSVEVVGPIDGTFLVRAPDHRSLSDALAACPRPKGRLRVEVDPLRQ